MLWSSSRLMDMQNGSRLRLLLTPYPLDMKICLHSCIIRLLTYGMYFIYNLHLSMLNYSVSCHRFFCSFSTYVFPYHMCSICCICISKFQSQYCFIFILVRYYSKQLQPTKLASTLLYCDMYVLCNEAVINCTTQI